jgi:hypothetical protein
MGLANKCELNMELGCEICIIVGWDISIKRVIKDHDYFGSDNGTKFFGTWEWYDPIEHATLIYLHSRCLHFVWYWFLKLWNYDIFHIIGGKKPLLGCLQDNHNWSYDLFILLFS